jgi:signal transduction histidine kinase
MGAHRDRSSVIGPALRGVGVLPGPTPTQWLVAALVAAALCFVGSTFYVSRWAIKIDAAALSIADNGAPSVVYLSSAREDVSLIEHHAEQARPETQEAEKVAIAGLTEQFDDAVRAYRATEDYPGEREASEVMSRQRVVFFSAVTEVLAHAGSAPEHRQAALARLASATDTLLLATRELVLINMAQVTSASAEITVLRRRAAWLTHLGEALALGFTATGTLMSFRVARRRLDAVEEVGRLSAVRAAELDVFAGRVAHDLRNPLSNILMRSELAQRSPEVDTARAGLVSIGHQAQRMSAIIDALLSFARAGARPEPGASCEVAAVVSEIVTEARPSAIEARIELTAEPGRGERVACDPTVLAVVLSNLVGNAVKYMGEDLEGERRITVRARPRTASVRIEVEDTGPGIPPGSEARVFEPFVRFASGPATLGGIGLGLATVKRLVEANHGRVGVEVLACRGCRFWLALPRAERPGPSA